MSRRLRMAVLIALLLAAIGAPAHARAAQLVLRSVDTSAFPAVTLGVSLPAELTGAGKTPAFSVWENGVRRSVTAAAAVQRDREPVEIVLLMDVSGSMKGAPMADARAAAKRFVARMGRRDRIALVAFGERARTVAGFTADAARLDAAIDSLQVDGETALYDGLARAAALVGGRTSAARYIVLLSDGGDTVSGTSVDGALTAVEDAGVPVYAVTLVSPEYDPGPLRLIARRSGGKVVPVKRSAELGALYEGIAAEIANQYLVTFKSAAPRTTDLELRVRAAAAGAAAEARTTVANPAFVATTSRAGLVVPRRNAVLDALGYGGAVGLVFVAVGLLVGGLALLATPERNALAQVRFYEQIRAAAPPDTLTPHGDEGLRGRIVDAVDFVAGAGGFKGALRARLERAGLPLRPVEYMTFHTLGVLAAGFLTQLLLHRLLATMAVILLAVFVPLVAIDLMSKRRSRAFEEQLPDVLTLIAGSLRAGWGIQQAIDLVVEDAAEPARGEFARVQSETRLGMPLEDSLERMADRLSSEDFRWTVAAITIQREVGGNLAEVLDIVSATIRDRADLRREVRALTAEGRLSSVVLTVLPFIMLGALSLLNPGYMSRLYGSVLGLLVLGIGLALLVIGVVWLNLATRIEV